MSRAYQSSWLRPVSRLARFIYTRSYERELDINLEALDELRERSKDHLLLFLWSHKSHMDSFVFLLSLYENRFRPLPLIFAAALLATLPAVKLALSTSPASLLRGGTRD